jgi:PAS domain S-box-containing protein
MVNEPRDPTDLPEELTELRRRVAVLEQVQVERDKVEKALRAADERYRALLAAVPDLMIRIRRDGTFLDFTPSTEFATYVPPDQFLGARLQDIMPPQMVEQVKPAIERAVVHRSRETVQYEVPESHGIRHYEARIVATGPDDVVAIVRDITERKQAEDALRESERRYRRLFQHSQGLVCTHDLDGTLLEVNAAAARSLGFEPEEVAGRNLGELLAPSVRHLFEPYLERMRRLGVDTGLMQVFSKSRESRFWAYHNVVEKLGDRAPYVIGHALDVTDLKQAEQSARRSETCYWALFDHAPFGICRWNAAGELEAANPALVAMLGYGSQDELRGLDPSTVYLDMGIHDRILDQCREGCETTAVHTRWRCLDGSEIAVHLQACATFGHDGRLHSVEMIVQEASDGN